MIIEMRTYKLKPGTRAQRTVLAGAMYFERTGEDTRGLVRKLRP
jgi:hypothetical protein